MCTWQRTVKLFRLVAPSVLTPGASVVKGHVRWLLQVDVIHEEDECESDPSCDHSHQGDSVALSDELNGELSRVASEFDRAIAEERAGRAHSHPPVGPTQNEQQLLRRVGELENRLATQETEISHMRTQTSSLQDERDCLRKKVRDLQMAVTSYHHHRQLQQQQHSNEKSADEGGIPVAKIAELKKLRTGSLERQVHGSEATALANTKIAEHLATSVKESSGMQEIAYRQVQAVSSRVNARALCQASGLAHAEA